MEHPSFTEPTSSLLIDESPMQFLPSLAGLLGSDSALFLQQLHYWLRYSPNIHEGRRWVYNTIDEWNMQFFFWSKSKLQRILDQLKHFTWQGETYPILIVSEFNADAFNHMKWLTIDYDTLNRLIPLAQEKRMASYQKLISGSPVLQKRLPKLCVKYPGLADYLPAESATPAPAPATPNSRQCQDDPIEKNKAIDDNVKMKLSKSSTSDPADNVKMTISGECQNDHIEDVRNNISTINTKNTDTKNTNRSSLEDKKKKIPPEDTQKEKFSPSCSSDTNPTTSSAVEIPSETTHPELWYLRNLLSISHIRFRKEDEALLLYLLDTYGGLNVEQAILTGRQNKARTLAYIHEILKSQREREKITSERMQYHETYANESPSSSSPGYDEQDEWSRNLHAVCTQKLAEFRAKADAHFDPYSGNPAISS